ncbi:MAG: membrane protein insertase YidC [Terracidiphilus sp.]
MPEIRNPNLEPQGSGGGGHSGGDFRSLTTFTFIVLIAVLGFQYFRPKENPPAPAPQTQQATQPAPQEAASAAAVSAQAGQPSATPAISSSSETETVVENELYRIVFTNRGAQVKHWFLKQYEDTAGKPLDLVQPQLAERFGNPLSFYTYDSALTSQLNQALYQASATGSIVAPGTLTFHFAQNGLDVVKTFHFDSSFVVSVDADVKRNGVPVRALIAWPAGLGDMEEFLPASATRSPIRSISQLDWSIDGKHETMKSAKVGGNATFDQPYEYAALSDLYFAAAFLPDSPAQATLVTLHNTVDLPSDLTNPASQKKPDDVLGLAMGDVTGSTRLRLYAGPKQMDVLRTIHAMSADGKPNGPTLVPLIQFGDWLGLIAKPLYLALRWLRDLLGPGAYNWGWAIIILTIIFNLLMLPTRFMAMKSSLKMMRIQPKVDAIRRRYANLKATDPKRTEMNSEMMQLYKDEGVNMYGGCLPMLPQIPLFFAYFRVLQNAVELRQAHWFWLTDLSAPDPLHILPALIIVSMFLVTYMTPSPGMDASQRRMMAIVSPVFMGFLLWHYASGLALYWGTSNLINIALQLGINQSSMGKEMHEIAARRAQKKVGSGPRVVQGKR